MIANLPQPAAQVVDTAWIAFPGGELEGERPKTLCPSCREQLKQAATTRRPVPNNSSSTSGRGVLCFQCYRAGLEHERRLKAAGQLDTASEDRFQTGLPFEPVNRARLEMLRAERSASRVAAQRGAGRFTTDRRQAQ